MNSISSPFTAQLITDQIKNSLYQTAGKIRSITSKVAQKSLNAVSSYFRYRPEAILHSERQNSLFCILLISDVSIILPTFFPVAFPIASLIVIIAAKNLNILKDKRDVVDTLIHAFASYFILKYRPFCPGQEDITGKALIVHPRKDSLLPEKLSAVFATGIQLTTYIIRTCRSPRSMEDPPQSMGDPQQCEISDHIFDYRGDYDGRYTG